MRVFLKEKTLKLKKSIDYYENKQTKKLYNKNGHVVLFPVNMILSTPVKTQKPQRTMLLCCRFLKLQFYVLLT